MDDVRNKVVRFILPANRAVSLRIIVFAISLAALGFAVLGFAWLSEQILELGAVGAELVYMLCGVAVIGAAINGYVNDDFAVSTCIAAGPLVGFVLFAVSAKLGTEFAPLAGIGMTATKAGLLTLGVGSAVGAGSVWAGRRYGGGRSQPTLE